jgi:hypothetical protein
VLSGEVTFKSLLSTLSTTNRPAIPSLAEQYNTPNKRTQLTLADFLTGQAMSRSIV